MKATNQAFTNSAATVEDLGVRWSAAQGKAAEVMWRFARSVAAFVAANPKVKLADIGAACATAAGRAKPYSKVWACRAVKAANAFKVEPATPADATAFSDIFHGVNSANRKAGKKAPPSAEEALKAARAFLRRAVKLGLGVEEAREAMTEECDSLESGDEAEKVKAAA